MSDEARRGRGLLGRLKGALGDGKRGDDVPERRGSKRIGLPIPVQFKVEGGELKTRRLRDISQQSLAVEAAGGGAPGESVVVRFEGYPDVCGPFILAGKIVRVTEEIPAGLVIHIDRQRTPSEALQQYRTLVLHYIRHKPLLDDISRGYFEGRCVACGWIGRVGAKKPTCPRCGEEVVPVDEPA